MLSSRICRQGGKAGVPRPERLQADPEAEQRSDMNAAAFTPLRDPL
jgi:hypothetical protein